MSWHYSRSLTLLEIGQDGNRLTLLHSATLTAVTPGFVYCTNETGLSPVSPLSG